MFRSELDAVKQALDIEKSISEELLSQNKSLQQQQQLMAMENRRLTEELQTRKDRIKQLWQTSCKQLQGFDQSLLTKEEELQTARRLLQQVFVSLYRTGIDPHAVVGQAQLNHSTVQQESVNHPYLV